MCLPFPSGHDGSVRTWKVGSRTVGPQEHTLIFQASSRAGPPHSTAQALASPTPVELMAVLPSGHFVAAASHNVLNVWPLGGGFTGNYG